jgi:16S rRNA processing protein RimM
VVKNSETTADFITLARVVKTQGRHGEVAAEIHSDVPQRFAGGMKLFALPMPKGAKQPLAPEKGPERVLLTIEDLWPHKGLLVLKFAGVDSMNDAEALIGAELQLPRAERAILDQGWTYVSDLIGCTVFDHGREIGRIADVQFGAGEAPLLMVAKGSEGGEVTKGVTKGGEVTKYDAKYDVPFAEAYLESVDAAKREVRMNLPEGMLEINAPMTAEEKQQQANSRK